MIARRKYFSADFAGGEVWLLFCNQQDVFSPSSVWFLSYCSDQGRFQLNRDERASLAAKAKDGLQLVHEVNELLCWAVLPAVEQWDPEVPGWASSSWCYCTSFRRSKAVFPAQVKGSFQTNSFEWAYGNIGSSLCNADRFRFVSSWNKSSTLW